MKTIKKEKKKSKYLTVSVPESLYQDIAKIAESNEITVSTASRLLLLRSVRGAVFEGGVGG